MFLMIVLFIFVLFVLLLLKYSNAFKNFVQFAREIIILITMSIIIIFIKLGNNPSNNSYNKSLIKVDNILKTTFCVFMKCFNGSVNNLRTSITISVYSFTSTEKYISFTLPKINLFIYYYLYVNFFRRKQIKYSSLHFYWLSIIPMIF